MKPIDNRSVLAAVTTSVLLAALAAGATPLHSHAQESQAQTYRLVTVNGTRLPMIVEQDEGCTEEVRDATLTLHADGRWLLETSSREVCGDRTEDEKDRESGTYTTEGATLRFDVDDEDGLEDEDDGEIDVDDLADGRREAGALTVQLEDGRTTLVFEG